MLTNRFNQSYRRTSSVSSHRQHLGTLLEVEVEVGDGRKIETSHSFFTTSPIHTLEFQYPPNQSINLIHSSRSRDCWLNFISYYDLRHNPNTFLHTCPILNKPKPRNSRIDKCAVENSKLSIEDNPPLSTTAPWAQFGRYGVRTRSL